MQNPDQTFITITLSLRDSERILNVCDYLQKKEIEGWYKEPIQILKKQLRRKTNGK